ncbi:MAG TPA: autotransporter-associated beta strand repeat-containing protein [Verrucomicrobiae bacterium]|nr:autotransporter-associated beta strand repeat-containing protein [Verrucomicrobiae bacterium]
MPFHSELQMNGPFTVSYWYRMDAATPAGTFPGIMRIGSQSATTGANVGWGFFRTANMVYKRGNNQPGIFGAMNVGQWYHLALRFDGSLTGNNTMAFLNGVQVNFAAVNGWSNCTATTIFEIGRMDAFDQATLDDLALWNEAVTPAKIRSLYTVPVTLNLDYNLADLRMLWSAFDSGSSATVKGTTWSYAVGLSTSAALGDCYINAGNMYVVLGTGVGVSAPLTLLTGTISPGGIGALGQFPLIGLPVITVSNANLVFDLKEATNDTINITGDLNIVNSRISFDPLVATETAGTYRLITYTGTKTGSLTVSNNSHFTYVLDESTPGEINLTVTGMRGAVRWNSTSSGIWDLGAPNWFDLNALSAGQFFQGDEVTFDDSGAFQTNITITTPVFPGSIRVNSSRNYTFAGTEQIGGMEEGLIKEGTGTLTLSSPNTFIGQVYVGAGTLRLGNSSALGTTNSSDTTFINAGATLDLNGTSLGGEPFILNGAGLNSTGAVINTGAALSNNGIRGRVILDGDTTFGGINRWDMINANLVGGGFKLTKTGPPEIALINLGDTGLGDVEIRQGTLTIQGATGLGDNTKAVTVNANAALAFWANGNTVLDKPVVMNSAIMRNNTSGGTDVTTNLGAVTINGDARFELGANIALLGVVSGPGNVVKQSAGTLYLGGANTYTGNTTISAGRLAMLASGSINASPRINLPASTTFDVTRVVGGYSLASGQTLAGSGSVAGSLNVPGGATVIPGLENVAGTIPISGNLALSGGTLNIDIASPTTEGAGVNDLITVAGNLDLSGLSTIAITPLGLLTVGNTYNLISYTGTLTGTEGNLQVVSGSRYTFTLSTLTPGKVTLTVTAGAAADLAWFGGTPAAETLWDLQSTANWSDMLGNPTGFFAGDNVLFDDFANLFTVDLVGALTPAAVRVENGEADYVFQGSGKLSGNASFTKLYDKKLTIANTAVNDFVGPITIEGGTLQVGTGSNFGNLGGGAISNNATLIFNRSDDITIANNISGAASGSVVKQNANVMVLSGNNATYSGAITANGGTLRPSNANALGDANGGTTIASGATLDINGINLGAESVTASGAGPTGAGAIINNGAGQNNALRFVTLGGNTTVSAPNRWDIRANPTAALNTGGNPYNLTKVGANQLSLVDVVVDPALADINVQAGTLSIELSSGAGDPTKNLNVANNALLQFFNRSVNLSKNVVLNGGRNIFNNSGASTMDGLITLNGTVTMEVAGTSLTIVSNIVGTGALTKTGASPLILLADNSYTGATTVSAGVLQLGGGTNAGWVAGPIAVGGNTLTVYRSDLVVVSNTLTGTGTLNVRTPAGMRVGGTQNFATLNVGQDSAGKLIMDPNYNGTHQNIFIGNPANIPGDVVQSGGNVTVSVQFRVGHWPNETSSYTLDGGTLNITGVPAGIPNQAGVAEQNGILYLGIDGTGIFTQNAGSASAHGIVLDARGNTAGTDTFTLNGGRFTVGPSGIKSGSLDGNTTYQINLGGGTIASSVNWTSVLRMTFSGTNGNTVFEQNGNSAVLSGTLTGGGGLIKRGTGTLVLSGTSAYTNGTTVNAGTLLVTGSVGTGGGAPVSVTGGTLAGNGVINDPVQVVAPGAISPGLSIGTLAINNSLRLAGNTIMEISKAGSVLSNDKIVGVSALTYDSGGTLTVTASGSALAEGDTFKLFDAATYSGAFGTLSLPALPTGLSWDVSRLAVDGTIRVWVRRPTFSFTRNGNELQFAWDPSFNDFELQGQTNAPGIGITTNWVTIPNSTNVYTITVDPNVGSAFYRLVKP